MNVNGDASAPQFVQRIDSWPIPSTRVSGHSVPQPGQTGATNGSPLKRPSIGWSLPDDVAIDVTEMSRMRRTTASPTSAPSTATGRVTSWPPRIAGVIIGPQQPGAVFATMWPPSATGPSISTSGPSRPSVNSSTNTVRRACWVLVTAMGSSLASCRGRQQGDFVAVGEHVLMIDVGASQHREGGAHRCVEIRVGVAERDVEIVQRRAIAELDRELGARGQPYECATQSNADAQRRLLPGLGRLDYCASMSRCATAIATSCARVCAPTFAIAWRTCVRTVSGDSVSRSAISAPV